MTARVQAIIFDLDGVITDTARYHFSAWQRLAATLGISLNDTDEQGLKGIDRLSSLNMILNKADLHKSNLEKEALAALKNQYYLELVSRMTPDEVFPGVHLLLEQIRAQGMLIGLASASKNASIVLGRLSLESAFDYIADAGFIKHSKPNPEIFLTVADALGVCAQDCIGIEDAAAGIQSIKTAGMFAVGIGNADYLSGADKIYASVAELKLLELLRLFDA